MAVSFYSDLVNALKRFLPERQYQPFNTFVLPITLWFTIPDRKIYEVFVYLTSGQFVYEQIGGVSRALAYNGVNSVASWFPKVEAHHNNVKVEYLVGNIDPVSGDVAIYPIYIDLDFIWNFQRASKGWILTEGEQIRSTQGSMPIRWRDVTNLER